MKNKFLTRIFRRGNIFRTGNPVFLTEECMYSAHMTDLTDMRSA